MNYCPVCGKQNNQSNNACWDCWQKRKKHIQELKELAQQVEEEAKTKDDEVFHKYHVSGDILWCMASKQNRGSRKYGWKGELSPGTEDAIRAYEDRFDGCEDV